MTDFTSNTQETIAGSVERITFHNEDNGFCVLQIKVKSHKELVTIIGNILSINAGEFIECLGDWINDKKYGIQFKATNLKTIPPNTVEGIEKYLGSGLIKGIGPHFAKILIRAFGKEIFTVIEQTPERLNAIPGIGDKRKQMILASWHEQKMVRDIMIFFTNTRGRHSACGTHLQNLWAKCYRYYSQ